MDISTLRWFVIVPIAFFGGLVAVLALLVFFAALLEKRRLRPWQPVGTQMPGRYSLAVPEAIEHGFHNLGVFRDRDGWMGSDVSLLVSKDRTVLLMAVHGRMPRVKLFTKLTGGPWMNTSDSGGEADLTGLELQEIMPLRFVHLLTYHRRRLERTNLTSVPFEFNEASVVADLLEHDRRRAGALLAAGHARWRDAGQSVWSYSLRGAFEVARVGIGNVNAGVTGRKRAEAEGLPAR